MPTAGGPKNGAGTSLSGTAAGGRLTTGGFLSRRGRTAVGRAGGAGRALFFRSRRAAFGPGLIDDEHDLPDRDLLAGLHFDFRDGAADTGRHFDRRLVGLELENGLIGSNDVTRRDEHANDVPFLDVFA